MKTILYFKAINFFNPRPSTHGVRISVLATSFDGSSQFKLYSVESDVYDEDQIKLKYPNTEWLDEDAALAFGKTLQPNRTVEDDITGEPYEFSFELPDNERIRLAKLKMTDKDVPRGVEDLIDVLIAKGTIEAADLPADLVDKINDKKDKRSKL